MTSSDWFRRFAFAFGPTFAVLYVVAVAKDWLCSLFSRRSASCLQVRITQETSPTPRWGFWLLRCTGTDGRRRLHSEH